MKKLIFTVFIILISSTIYSQSVPINGNGFHYYGPNTTWGEYLKVGGNGRATTKASVVTTNGNLHLDSKDGRNTYINHYSKTNTYLNTQGGNVGIGTSSPSGRLHVKGDTYVDGGWLRVKGQRGLYFQDYGGGFRMIDNSWIRTYGGKNFYHDAGTMRTDGTFEVGPSGNRFRVMPNGNVGIGTSNPETKLHVQEGRLLVKGSNPSMKIISTTAGYGSWLDIAAAHCNGCYSKFAKKGSIVMRAVSYKGDFIISNPGNTSISFATGNWNSAPNPQTERMTITNIGNVGIGTKTPDEKLAVNGNIHAKEVRVDLTGWPDYVFEDTYTLPTLNQVEKHIEENGHLINIPSATEVEEKGIQLGEMNKKLLEKIEELTLYTIEQEKKIQELETKISKNKELEIRVDKLEALFKKN